MSAVVTLRSAPGNRVQFQGKPENLPPDQLVKLRAYKDELASIIAAYCEVEVFVRPATPIPSASTWPPKPAVPRHWQDVDGWRALLRYAHLVEHRRWVVTRWAKAAGGSVENAVVTLPDDLPCGLALAELKTHARIVGLTVEVSA
jgi:hypothetical protein